MKISLPRRTQRTRIVDVITTHPGNLVQKNHRALLVVNLSVKPKECLYPIRDGFLRCACLRSKRLNEMIQLALIGHLLVGRQALDLYVVAGRSPCELADQGRFSDSPPPATGNQRTGRLAPERLQVLKVVPPSDELHGISESLILFLPHGPYCTIVFSLTQWQCHENLFFDFRDIPLWILQCDYRHALKTRISCAAWFSLRRPVGRLIAKSIVTAPPFFRIGLIHSIHWRSS